MNLTYRSLPVASDASRYPHERIREHIFVALIIAIPILVFSFGSTLATIHPTTAFAATTYYVATYGNDSNPGTEAQPWRTIQRAADLMGPGDTVLIRQGVYPELVVPPRSGTEGNYITFRNYASEEVVIDAQNKTIDHCINVSGQKYLAFTGLTLTGASSAAFLATDNSEFLILDGLTCQNSRFGIRLYGDIDPVSHVTIKDCITNGNSKYGIFLYKRVYDSTIGPNNHVFSNGGEDMSWGVEIGTDFPGSQSDGARRITVLDNEVNNNEVEGIRTWNAVNVLIKNNYCHHNGATGVQIEDGSENLLVDGNRSEYNAQTYEFEAGIWVHASKNVAVRGNYIRGNKIGLMVSHSQQVILRNNYIVENNRGVPNLDNSRGLNIYGTSTDVMAVHNTLYQNGAPQSVKGGVSIYEATGVVLKNNINSETLAPDDFWISQDYTSDYNVVFNSRPILVNWKGTQMSWSRYLIASGQDANSFAADPGFVAPDTGDFRLGGRSACINRGSWLTRTTDSRTGREIGVADARYFTDGFGFDAGDVIVVGRNEAATITGVDYAAKRITLSRNISWNWGDAVSFPYSGFAPDIGASEYFRARTR